MPPWALKVPHASCSKRRSAVAEAYWRGADTYERSNARLCKELEFAIPLELTPIEAINASSEFLHRLTTVEDSRLPYSFALHAGRGKNPHVHALISERVNDGIDRTVERWFRRHGPDCGAKKTDALKSVDWLISARKMWADVCNEHLEKGGHDVRIDHRSFEDAGIDRVPGEHVGVAGVGIQRKRNQRQREIKTGAVDADTPELPPSKRKREIVRRKLDAERAAVIDRELAILRKEERRLHVAAAAQSAFSSWVGPEDADLGFGSSKPDDEAADVITPDIVPAAAIGHGSVDDDDLLERAVMAELGSSKPGDEPSDVITPDVVLGTANVNALVDDDDLLELALLAEQEAAKSKSQPSEVKSSEVPTTESETEGLD